MTQRYPDDYEQQFVPPEPLPPDVQEEMPAMEQDKGGLENVPEEFLSADEQAEEELNHLGMEVELPGEDQARLEAEQDQRPWHGRHGQA